MNWDRDRAIIASFTEFTIALIPLAWITLFAARFARWFILFFSGWTMISALFSLWGGLFFGDRIALRMVEPTLIVATLVFVFLPSTSKWMKNAKEHPSEVFQ
ncbi:MAG: hypothetical protein AAGA34_00720 [Pseudomonadota bacterium]